MVRLTPYFKSSQRDVQAAVKWYAPIAAVAALSERLVHLQISGQYRRPHTPLSRHALASAEYRCRFFDGSPKLAAAMGAH